jgi:hypothetical protein
MCPATGARSTPTTELRTSGRWHLSAYALSDGARIWVITEADRSSTCILLPEEY